jgi:hypothetical protein
MQSAKKWIAAFLFFSSIAGLTSCGKASVKNTDTAEHVPTSFFLVIDTSGSMKDGKLDSVKRYIETNIFNKLLFTGDFISIIPFGTSADIMLAQTVTNDKERAYVLEKIRELHPDQEYTDIGFALETLSKDIEKFSRPNSRQAIMFFTDGKHAPPPNSRYQEKDISLDSNFKNLGEKFVKNGWYLYVVGLGETDGQKIADTFSNSIYQKVDTPADINFEPWFNSQIMAKIQSAKEKMSSIKFTLQLHSTEEKERSITFDHVGYRILWKNGEVIDGQTLALNKKIGFAPKSEKQLAFELPYSKDYAKIVFTVKADKLDKDISPNTFEWEYQHIPEINKFVNQYLFMLLALALVIIYAIYATARPVQVEIENSNGEIVKLKMKLHASYIFNDGNRLIFPGTDPVSEIFEIKRMALRKIEYTGLADSFMTKDDLTVLSKKDNSIIPNNGETIYFRIK